MAMDKKVSRLIEKLVEKVDLNAVIMTALKIKQSVVIDGVEFNVSDKNKDANVNIKIGKIEISCN